MNPRIKPVKDQNREGFIIILNTKDQTQETTEIPTVKVIERLIEEEPIEIQVFKAKLKQGKSTVKTIVDNGEIIGIWD